MKAIRLACRYSYGCTTATRLDINDLLLNCARGEDCNCKKLKRLFEKNFDFFPYLLRIASSKDPWKEEFLRAYWLGEKVNNIQDCHASGVLYDFKDLCRKVKDQDVLNLVLDCLILPARIVEKCGENSFRAETIRVVFKEGRFLAEDREDLIGWVIDDGFKKGDLVCLHLGRIVEKITISQQLDLLETTKQVFEIK